MNRPSNKILLLIIAVLLLTNIAVLAYFLVYRQDKGPGWHTGATELLKSDVGFSDAQIEEYKKLKDQQRETIRPLYQDMRNSKDSLFSMVGDSVVNEGLLDSITDRIGYKQKSIDKMTFLHFSELRRVCRPDQVVAYDSMVVQLFRKMNKPPQRPDDKKK